MGVFLVVFYILFYFRDLVGVVMFDGELFFFLVVVVLEFVVNEYCYFVFFDGDIWVVG